MLLFLIQLLYLHVAVIGNSGKTDNYLTYHFPTETGIRDPEQLHTENSGERGGPCRADGIFRVNQGKGTGEINRIRERCF